MLVNATNANPAQTLARSLAHNSTSLQNLNDGQDRLTCTPPLGLPNGLY